MITINNLKRVYRISRESKRALNNINLTIADTGMICICGKSGSGKSTLLNIIGLSDNATSGEILYNGVNILNYSEKQKNHFRQFIVSRISQEYDLIPEMSVSDNCALALSLRAGDRAEVSAVVRSALARVGLEGFENRKVNSLSGGERQRVAIARAIALESEILLCDEPTGNLDPETSEDIMTILKELSKDICVIIVTHNRILADKYADRLIAIDKGEVVSDIPQGIEKAADPSGKTEKPRQGKTPFQYLLKFALFNISSKKLLSAAVLVLLSALICILLTVTYMSDYSCGRAVAETMKQNGIYSVPLSRYSVSAEDGHIEFIKESTGVTSDEELAELTAIYPDLSFGDIYSFGRNFCDFSDADTLKFDAYRCVAFTDFVIIRDFSALAYPLAAGRMPEQDNEVVIFDYMADNMLHSGAFKELSSREDIVGYTLFNKATGFSMTVSGILESPYQTFENIDRGISGLFQNEDWFVANACLSVFRCVFGGESFAEKLKSDSWYISAENVEYNINLSGKKGDIRSYQGTEAARWLFSSEEEALTKDIHVIYEMEGGSALFIRDTVLANIMNVPVSELTNEFLETAFQTLEDSLSVSFRYSGYNAKRLEYFAYYRSSDYTVSGVFHSDCADAPLSVIIDRDSINRERKTGIFAGKLLLLTDRASTNSRVLNYLLPKSFDVSSFENEESSVKTGLYAYTFFDEIIDEMDEFLQIMNRIYTEYSWLLIALLAFAVFAYTVASIKKNCRAIGIFRSVGASQMTVISIYSALALMIASAAFVMAVPLSLLLTERVNMILSSGLGTKIIFYSIIMKSVASAFLVTSLSVLIALVVLSIWLKLRKPISLIHERKD